MPIKKRTLIRLGSCLIILMIGVGVYVVYNPKALFLTCLGVNLPYLVNSSRSLVSTMISSYLADYLWAVSFTMIIQSIMDLKREWICLLLLCPLLGVIFEVMQYLNWVSGTSDILDVLVYYLGSLTVIMMEKFFQGGKKYEES